VGVLFPAVLRHEGDEDGGVEINQEKFLEAEGEDGVERLVGAGGRAKKEGWKFWRVSESRGT
jgi:mevalonate kinase